MRAGKKMKSRVTKLRAVPLVAVAAGVMLLSGFTNSAAQPSTGAVQVSPNQMVAQAGPGCLNYTPTQLAVDRTLYIAADTITVTGVVEASDTVSASLSGGTLGTLNLGTATADGSGQFSITGTLPDPITPGSYTVSVTSTQCPTAGTITITVVEEKSSSCTDSRATRTFYPGQRVKFTLFTPIYSTSHPVTITLLKPSYSSVLYNGPWPSNDKVSFTIPATATPGADYTLEQLATRANGNGTKTKDCPIWIVEGPSFVQGQVLSEELILDNASVKGQVAERSDASPLAFTGGNAAPMVAIGGVLILAGFALVRLRRRQAF